jgi:hypothetical protein
MKNKILALLASLSMSGFVFGDIQIGENVTIKGFLDASYQNTNSDAAATDSSDVSLDEVEIDFLFNSGAVSARVDLDTNPNSRSGNDGMSIEQAHFTYTNDGGLSVTIGRMGTLLGFEREDPSGTYTYSRAYGRAENFGRFNLGNIDGAGLRNSSRNDGVRFGYAADSFTANVSVDQGEDRNLDLDDSRLNYEVHVAYTGVENFILGLGYRNDRSEASAEDVDIINVNGAYVVGKALLAAEYTTWNPETASEETLDAFMLLLDYDFSDKFGAAVRYSTEDYIASGGTNQSEQTKWTIAPNYQITDNLGTVVEFSSINPDGANDDSTQFAVELTYTF